MRSYLLYQRAVLALLAAAITGCSGMRGSQSPAIGALPSAAGTRATCPSEPIVRPVFILVKNERFKVAGGGAYTVESLNPTITVRKLAEDPSIFDVLPTTNQSVPASTIRVTDDATKAKLEFRVSMWVTGKVIALKRVHALVAERRPAACDQQPIVQPVNMDPTGSYYSLGGPYTVTSSNPNVAIQMRDNILQLTGVGVKPASSDAVITVKDNATGTTHTFKVVYPGV
ncbi:MAG TPA: hypothetical protein VK760_10525 [Candidatus Acidoferrales bacterium]|jgi:hypothetical protein|nr:hypothetical protein [Candidatus Acidoferrales bacterium]